MLHFLENAAFYVKSPKKHLFQNGFSMEEYFLKHMSERNIAYDKQGRLYIPCLWTNFQNEERFEFKIEGMQEILDFYIKHHPNPRGYFTVVEDRRGPMLRLPNDTFVYNTEKIPCIYEDTENFLSNLNKKYFKDKTILCSFVGDIKNNLQTEFYNTYNRDPRFKFSIIEKNDIETKKNEFINIGLNSKFSIVTKDCLYRFFDILKLGTIPVFVFDEYTRLPYDLDYKKFSILIKDTEIDILDEVLSNINKNVYKTMLEEYEKVNHMFTLEYMCEYISGFSQVNREPMQKPIKCLLATIVIGDENIETYNKTFKKSHEFYAKKHNYDFEVLTNYIDPSYSYNNLSIEFQKLLICNKERNKDYDFIIYINSKTFINPKSPPVHSVCSLQGKIGIVDAYQQNYPFNLEINKVLNSSVYIIQPDLHKPLFESIYYQCMPDIIAHNREPILLNDDLQIQSIYTKTIPNKWNAIYQSYNENLNQLITDNYFIHFFGDFAFDKVHEYLL